MFGKEIKVFPKNSSIKKRDCQLLHISPVGHTHTHTHTHTHIHTHVHLKNE